MVHTLLRRPRLGTLRDHLLLERPDEETSFNKITKSKQCKICLTGLLGFGGRSDAWKCEQSAICANARAKHALLIEPRHTLISLPLNRHLFNYPSLSCAVKSRFFGPLRALRYSVGPTK